MTILNHLEQCIDVCFASIPRPVPSKSRVEQARLIAHRGAHDQSLGIIENTHAAFERAMDIGCWGIELDIHASADNRLMVNHDPTLTRIWNQDLSIGQSSFSLLQRQVPMMPVLEDVVARFSSQMHLFIELKSPFTAQRALQNALKQLNPCIDYHLLSLDETVFQTLDTFPRQAMLLVAMPKNAATFVTCSIEKGYGGVLGHYLLLTRHKINRLHEAGQIGGVGFINSKYSLYRELNRGIRYLFSNNAQCVSEYLREIIP